MTADDSLRLADFLRHLLEAIERCRRYTADMDEATFLHDEKTQDAVIRTFEIMGEAANNILKRFPDFAALHAEIPWRSVVGMRNVLAHGYFRVELSAVWRTAQTDVPALYASLSSVVEGVGDGG